MHSLANARLFPWGTLWLVGWVDCFCAYGPTKKVWDRFSAFCSYSCFCSCLQICFYFNLWLKESSFASHFKTCKIWTIKKMRFAKIRTKIHRFTTTSSPRTTTRVTTFRMKPALTRHRSTSPCSLKSFISLLRLVVSWLLRCILSTTTTIRDRRTLNFKTTMASYTRPTISRT